MKKLTLKRKPKKKMTLTKKKPYKKQKGSRYA